MEYRPNCRHFRGDIPCTPHKLHGVVCSSCEYFTLREGRILIIKLGATGDVIRTTTVLEPIRSKYPNHELWWLTYTPEIVPKTVDKRLAYTLQNIQHIQATHFDVVYNLDKDAHACALASTISATERFGFTLNDGLPSPVNDLATHKFLTGIFDTTNKANTLSYPREIVELCGFEYTGQEYQIDSPGPAPITIPGSGTIVGLNTGCGERWISREWPMQYWTELIQKLSDAGCRVLLLGGESEHERNLYLQKETVAEYYGTFPLKEFVAIVNLCDVVVSAVTMAMHVAIGLHKPLVLMNNIFNPHEFELYGRGQLVEPSRECKCFFGQTCTNEEYRCMEHLTPDTILKAVLAQR